MHDVVADRNAPFATDRVIAVNGEGLGRELVQEILRVERDFAGLQFKEKIQLCGAFSLDPEDFLYELATETFAVNGDDTVCRERRVTVGDEIVHLDGMPEPTDEVYAKVWVTPVLPRPDFQVSSILEQAF